MVTNLLERGEVHAGRWRGPGFRSPSIALSGYAQSEDLARTRDAGFDQHLAKPVRIDHRAPAGRRPPARAHPQRLRLFGSEERHSPGQFSAVTR